jgi:hypothetical protein
MKPTAIAGVSGVVRVVRMVRLWDVGAGPFKSKIADATVGDNTPTREVTAADLGWPGEVLECVPASVRADR